MHQRPGWILVFFAAAMLALAGCAPAAKFHTPEAAAEIGLLPDQVPRTLAILPFENNSVTQPEHFEPLSRGLSAMLITDL